MKWGEKASYSSVTQNVVQKLLKKDILCPYGLPERIITDNVKIWTVQGTLLQKSESLERIYSEVEGRWFWARLKGTSYILLSRGWEEGRREMLVRTGDVDEFEPSSKKKVPGPHLAQDLSG